LVHEQVLLKKAAQKAMLKNDDPPGGGPYRAGLNIGAGRRGDGCAEGAKTAHNIWSPALPKRFSEKLRKFHA
jgi:hypothetical protein